MFERKEREINKNKKRKREIERIEDFLKAIHIIYTL